MIPDQPTFPKGTRAQLAPARTIAATTFPVDLSPPNFAHKNVRWIDDPNGETVTAVIPPLPASIVIMGAGTKTVYKSDWTEQDARSALLAQLELPPPVVVIVPPGTSSG